jgi:hypothetical protein
MDRYIRGPVKCMGVYRYHKGLISYKPSYKIYKC